MVYKVRIRHFQSRITVQIRCNIGIHNINIYRYLLYRTLGCQLSWKFETQGDPAWCIVVSGATSGHHRATVNMSGNLYFHINQFFRFQNCHIQLGQLFTIFPRRKVLSKRLTFYRIFMAYVISGFRIYAVKQFMAVLQ